MVTILMFNKAGQFSPDSTQSDPAESLPHSTHFLSFWPVLASLLFWMCEASAVSLLPQAPVGLSGACDHRARNWRPGLSGSCFTFPVTKSLFLSMVEGPRS